jgi:2-hydroxy-6-oxonona-2,4-dienedioate hydrolase
MEQSTAGLASKWTTVLRLPMHARVSVNPLPPDAPTIVLVHGLGVSGRYMLPLAQRLAACCRVYVPDLPGFGKSAGPSRSLAIPELTDALAAWVGALRLPAAAFLANSVGCQVTVDLATRYPELIDRAILIGPTVDPRGRTFLRQVGRALLDLPRESLSLWPILFRDYLAAGPVRTLMTLRHALKDRVECKLRRVQVPTLVMRGSGDTIVPQRWSREMCRRLPQAELVVVPNAAHAAHFSEPDVVARAVLVFLEYTGIQRSAEETSLSLAT